MNQFEKETIDLILKIRDGTWNILVRRESTKLEFKKNFNFASLCDYGKILLSMANNKGGYIVFGVTDKRPHKLIGMSNDQFEKIDSKLISELFDIHFSPTLVWDYHIEKIGEIMVGFLYVESSREKPVMCIHSGKRGEYNEGDIYYRYAGNSSPIKSSDLQRIIRERIDDENMKWRRILENIAKVSPSKISLLNEESGEFIGDKNVVIVDESLLSQMRFIKEGEFNETEGTPIYKIVGNIQNTRGATIVKEKINVPKLIHRKDIINSFFEEKCEDPTTYLKQFPYESTIYLPFWFFIKISDLSVTEIESIWLELNDAKEYIRSKLIDRLRNENIDRFRVGKIISLKGNYQIDNVEDYKKKYKDCKSLNMERIRSYQSLERSFILNLINNDCLKHFTDEFIKSKYVLIFEAFSNFEKEKIIENKVLISSIIKKIYKIHKPKYSSNLRKCICYIDYMLNKDDVSE